MFFFLFITFTFCFLSQIETIYFPPRLMSFEMFRNGSGFGVREAWDVPSGQQVNYLPSQVEPSPLLGGGPGGWGWGGRLFYSLPPFNDFTFKSSSCCSKRTTQPNRTEIIRLICKLTSLSMHIVGYKFQLNRNTMHFVCTKYDFICAL